MKWNYDVLFLSKRRHSRTSLLVIVVAVLLFNEFKISLVSDIKLEGFGVRLLHAFSAYSLLLLFVKISKFRIVI